MWTREWLEPGKPLGQWRHLCIWWATQALPEIENHEGTQKVSVLTHHGIKCVAATWHMRYSTNTAEDVIKYIYIYIGIFCDEERQLHLLLFHRLTAAFCKTRITLWAWEHLLGMVKISSTVNFQTYSLHGGYILVPYLLASGVRSAVTIQVPSSSHTLKNIPLEPKSF